MSLLDEERDAGQGQKLPRVLGPMAALSVIVGSVIGSGIFIVPARVAREIPAIGPIVLAWVVGGLFSLAGALTLAELAAMLPHAGGPYVYLRKAYGPLMAYLFGWTEFLVIRAGSVATLAAAFALYASQLVPAPEAMRPEIWQMILAVAAMTLVAIVNVIGTKVGGGVQVVGTVLKVGALGAMIVLPFVLGKADAANLAPVWPRVGDGSYFTGFMVAMVGVLWAYDGWVNTSSLAEEIHDPGRNIPRAMGLGMAILITVYLGMTVVYHLVLPMPEIASAATEKGSPRVVAAVFCQKLVGAPGLVAISLAVMCSTLISLNGNALSGPRAYFAMARDGLFPRALCRIHPRFQTPANAVIAQAAWAIALTLAGTAFIVLPPPEASTGAPPAVLRAWTTLHETPLYDVMYTYVIFGGTVIYTLTITSVFVLRRALPDWPRPYRTWGYPLTPILYLAASALLLSSMLRNNPFESIAGLGIIVLGVPAYLGTRRRLAARHS
jgi:APA family basic amino acid/polyamine antiporter